MFYNKNTNCLHWPHLEVFARPCMARTLPVANLGRRRGNAKVWVDIIHDDPWSFKEQGYHAKFIFGMIGMARFPQLLFRWTTSMVLPLWHWPAPAPCDSLWPRGKAFQVGNFEGCPSCTDMVPVRPPQELPQATQIYPALQRSFDEKDHEIFFPQRNTGNQMSSVYFVCRYYRYRRYLSRSNYDTDYTILKSRAIKTPAHFFFARVSGTTPLSEVNDWAMGDGPSSWRASASTKWSCGSPSSLWLWPPKGSSSRLAASTRWAVMAMPTGWCTRQRWPLEGKASPPRPWPGRGRAGVRWLRHPTCHRFRCHARWGGIAGSPWIRG